MLTKTELFFQQDLCCFSLLETRMSGVQDNWKYFRTGLNRVVLLCMEICIELTKKRKQNETLSKSTFVSFGCQTRNISYDISICGFEGEKQNLTWQKGCLAVFLVGFRNTCVLKVRDLVQLQSKH